MAINYDRFVRTIHRCKEVGTQQDADPTVAEVYKESFAARVEAYIAIDSAISDATIAREKEKLSAERALSFVNGPYKKARTALWAIRPETVSSTPETLKGLTTDTDKLMAIEWLLKTIQEDAGKPWADSLLNGDFGAKSAEAIDALKGLVTASSALTKAKAERAAVYSDTYTTYASFKKVVRETLGAGSNEYQRIRLRASASHKKDGEEQGDEAPEAPAGESTPQAAPGGAPSAATPTSSGSSTPVVSSTSIGGSAPSVTSIPVSAGAPSGTSTPSEAPAPAAP